MIRKLVGNRNGDGQWQRSQPMRCCSRTSNPTSPCRLRIARACVSCKARCRVLCDASSQRDLPNRIDLKLASKQDVHFLLNEIFQEQSYLQHGVQLRPADVVVDVGANIGLFTLQAADLVGEQGKVLSIEPGPEAFGALIANIDSFRTLCADAGDKSAEIIAINAAASRVAEETIKLTVYTESTGWSTTCPDNDEVQAGMRHFLSNALPSMQGIEDNLLSRAAQLLRRFAPRAIYEAVWGMYVGGMLGKATQVDCHTCTLSGLIHAHSLKSIDLLKIDVERAELDVLAGLASEDWPKVKQAVLEVHDIDGRLETVRQLFHDEGHFRRVVTVQAPHLKGSKLYNMYCTQKQRL